MLLGWFLNHVWIMSRSFFYDVGIILVSFWHNVCIIWGSLWHTVGIIFIKITQNFKNIGWSHGLQGRKSESTTPHLRGCVLELACRRSDRPGRSRNIGNRKSARMQERRASRCAALSFFLVASIGDATAMRSTPKSPWNREIKPLKLCKSFVMAEMFNIYQVSIHRYSNI